MAIVQQINSNEPVRHYVTIAVGLVYDEGVQLAEQAKWGVC